MPIGITTRSVTPFVLAADRGLELGKQTEFDIGPPTITQRTELAKMFAAAGRDPVEQLPVALQSCVACVRGWRKFHRVDGTAIEFETSRREVLGVVGDYVTEAALSHLQLEHLQELAIEAWARARLSEDDSGK